MRESIAHMNQLTKRATMLQEKKRLEAQMKGGMLDQSEEMNFFDLNKVNDDDLLAEMAELETKTKTTMLNLLADQKKFEASSQEEINKTLKQINKSMKVCIQDSTASISRRTKLRETMKQLQNGSITGLAGPDKSKKGECLECPKLKFQV